MIFNPDDVSKKKKKIPTNHVTVYFNNDPVIRENFQKHLRLVFDSKLSFFDCINKKTKKAAKGINVIRKMNLPLPQSSPMYKLFAWLHVDYEGVIYDQPNNSSLQDKIESI